MGVIRLTIEGSMLQCSPGNVAGASFSAQESGHAACVQEAISYLSNQLLPAAIRLDHKLHSQNQFPNDQFRVERPMAAR